MTKSAALIILAIFMLTVFAAGYFSDSTPKTVNRNTQFEDADREAIPRPETGIDMETSDSPEPKPLQKHNHDYNNTPRLAADLNEFLEDSKRIREEIYEIGGTEDEGKAADTSVETREAEEDNSNAPNLNNTKFYAGGIPLNTNSSNNPSNTTRGQRYAQYVADEGIPIPELPLCDKDFEIGVDIGGIEDTELPELPEIE